MNARHSYFTRCFLVVFLFLFATIALAAQNDAIKVSLEEPGNGKTYASISNLRGWAVAPTGIDRIELYIDGNYIYDLPYGGKRNDVGNNFPSYPDANESGFSMAYNYKNLSAGQHTITVRAIDGNGDFNESSSTFTSTRFSSAFIADTNSIDITGASSVDLLDNHSLKLSGIQAEGSRWDVTLTWDRSSQGFEIQQITPAAGPSQSCEHIAGIWSGTLNFNETLTMSGFSESDSFSDHMSFTVSQLDCNVTFTDNYGIYQDLHGTVNGNIVTIQGQAISDEDYEQYIEESLALNGITADASISSNQLTLTGTVSGTTMALQGTENVQGQIVYQMQSLGFTLTTTVNGNLYK